MVNRVDLENGLRLLLDAECNQYLIIDCQTVRALFENITSEDDRNKFFFTLKTLEGEGFINLGDPVGASPETYSIYSIQLDPSALIYFSNKEDNERSDRLSRKRNLRRDILIALISSIFGATLVKIVDWLVKLM